MLWTDCVLLVFPLANLLVAVFAPQVKLDFPLLHYLPFARLVFNAEFSTMLHDKHYRVRLLNHVHIDSQAANIYRYDSHRGEPVV
jgi:hypothetical protein